MVVDELKESVRLGQDMERDGFLKPQRVAETIKTLKMFRKLCDASGVSRIITVATEAVRKAKNSGQLRNKDKGSHRRGGGNACIPRRYKHHGYTQGPHS